MQILFLSDLWTVILCFVLWGGFQSLAAFICFLIPDIYYKPGSWVFRSHKWEKEGKIYVKILKVNKWKKYLPDGGAAFKKGYKKRNFTNYTRQGMEKYLVESCRGEMSHWLAIIPFWVFGFIAPIWIIIPMFLYALAINIPCIVAQRYNRPRFIALLLRI